MAAAFERAKAALDRTPPLSSAVERVLQRCGSRTDLLLEVAMKYTQPYDKQRIFIFTQTNLLDFNEMWVLLGRPLLTALQQGGARCAHCSPLGRLLIQSFAVSGSAVEGFMPRKITGGKIVTSSDVDYMLQMGPVLWEKSDAVCGVSQKAAAGSGAARSSTGADPGRRNDDTGPRLRVVLTRNPGFVLLYQVKQEQCTHREEHLFSGDSVRQLIHRFSKASWARNVEFTGSGPATTILLEQQPGGDENLCEFEGFDIVPCLRTNWWPSEEFFQRSRANDWPPSAVRDDIRRFGIHLVPVGAKGSTTELHEFRLSFSRPEQVAAWHLFPSQRHSLVALKLCKTALGPEGKPLKSYYIKTALLWLCQDSNVEQWNSIIQGMHTIIGYLERAIDARYLGCFFWSKINLLGQSSPADLAAMRHTLSLLQRSMTQLLAHEVSPYIEQILAPIMLREPFQQLPELQLRVCLVRDLVIKAVTWGIVGTRSQISPGEALYIQTFLRSSATAELAYALHNRHLQDCLFLALTVAPADVMAQCRLTSLGDDMFRWDAAPLIGLLTKKDLCWLLGDPAAVDAWLKDQHRLPTGLSSPRALADLLLNPSLLAEALRESVPWIWETMQSAAREVHKPQSLPFKMSFDDARKLELQRWGRMTTLTVFESLPPSGTQSALRRYRQFLEKARQFLDDPRTRAEYDRLRRPLPDPWRLRQFVFTDSQRWE